ncbi:MAG: tRNA 2-thiouridine(34) synthase MnmA [Verrucomicrobiales bacterium]
MAKILVGLSGGVDSSVAAALLAEQGHEVTGAYMKNWINEENIAGHCPWMEDIEDARRVADKLGIGFEVVNLMRDYRERVVRYLLEGYAEGVTPNPDVMCNREMKFGVFLEHALAHGYEGVATGHYARIARGEESPTRLLRGRDPGKDQSYFLALLQAHQVEKAWFPVGDLLKAEVRDLAKRFDLPNATKKDSQGICFIGEVKMRDFLRAFVADQPGEIVTTDGKVVGQHEGLHLYTLGQRKGHGIASPIHRLAYVVVGKDAARNRLIVGYDSQDTPGLYATSCRLSHLSWAGPVLAPGCAHRVSAQPRYRNPAPSATLSIDEDGEQATLVYDEPQRALTPGQICALYDLETNETLLGGAVFASIENQ